MSKSLTADYARSILNYDSETGRFTWLVRTPDMFDCLSPDRVCEIFNRDFAGREAGAFNKGYLTIYISGRSYSAHRLAWLITYGLWPENQIDHINGDKLDNRLENLRDVTAKVNSWNIDVSKLTGVRWDRKKNRWQARITHEGKRRSLGRYRIKEEAINAYHQALIVLRGDYIRNSPIAANT